MILKDPSDLTMAVFPALIFLSLKYLKGFLIYLTLAFTKSQTFIVIHQDDKITYSTVSYVCSALVPTRCQSFSQEVEREKNPRPQLDTIWV